MKTAILHYATPPVVGGVEAVIQAHAVQFVAAGLPLTVISGRGQADALPDGVDFIRIAELDTLHPLIAAATTELNAGKLPGNFEELTNNLYAQLLLILPQFDNVIIHNVLTKHFNLPLTAALFRLMDNGRLARVIAWCHDLTWSSPNSRSKVFPAYPWELLKSAHQNCTYIAISQQRQKEVSETFQIPADQVRVISNGVDSQNLLNLSTEGTALIERLHLADADLILLMPVRVTNAKNIEYALQVLAALKMLNCQPKLVLTGPPDPHDNASMAYYQSLLALRQSLQLEDAMHFVYESGAQPGKGYTIGLNIVADLYRVADALFMPSHREGFGMPVLEAGLLGLPVISTPVPAIRDIARDNALVFSLDTPAQDLAEQILAWINAKPEHRLRVKVRQQYTWKAIFERDIRPLLHGKAL